jgi:hypothetical protein
MRLVYSEKFFENNEVPAEVRARLGPRRNKLHALMPCGTFFQLS